MSEYAISSIVLSDVMLCVDTVPVFESQILQISEGLRTLSEKEMKRDMSWGLLAWSTYEYADTEGSIAFTLTADPGIIF